MKIAVLSLFALFTSSLVLGQLTISEVGGGDSLNGTVYVVEGSADENDIEHGFSVTNSSSTEYTVGCRRMELDVEVGTGIESTICWQICPAYVDAGEVPTRVSPFTVDLASGAVDDSFVMHLKPAGQDGCSSYRIEWFDNSDDTEVLATIDMIFDHSEGSCATGLDEAPSIETTLSPNPTSDITALTMTGVNQPVDIQIFDLLGQTITSEQFNPMAADRFLIDTSSMGNGIYFVSIQDESSVLKTIKMVVKH